MQRPTWRARVPRARRLASGAACALCVSALAACNRTEDSHSLRDAHEPSASEVAPAPSPTPTPTPVEPERCVVPLADQPPPKASPAPECPAETGSPPEMAHGQVSFPDAPASPRLTVEIAQSEPAKEHGLMFKKKLPNDQGMLFSWTDERRRTFWMHNTCIPLDMMFIAADGTIAGILEQVPVLNEAPRGVPCPAAHVLEVNAGWSRSHGIKPGMKIHIEG